MYNFRAQSVIGRGISAAEGIFWKFWWMILAMILCGIVLEQGLKAVRRDRDQLIHQQALLLQDKEKAIALRENLKLQINSQSDPAWVELTLKKELGLVPEGQTKVLFTD